MNVLIVDDDRVDIEMVKRKLHQSNLAVDIKEAYDVNMGIEVFHQHVFDLILLDYRMPQKDGIELINELRQQSGHTEVAIVVMSAAEDEELAVKCLNAGAQDYLVKSEVTSMRLRRAILLAQARFKLESELSSSYNKVKEMAEKDVLTGLANRYYFEESLKVILSKMNEKNQLTVILFDLDRFKYVNDSYGHEFGDELLKSVVDRVENLTEESFLFARLGGDEFALAYIEGKNSLQAQALACQIIGAFKQAFEIQDAKIFTSVSMGMSVYPNDSHKAEELLKFADIAMYRSKHMGGDKLCYFEQDMLLELEKRMSLEQALRLALKKNQMSLRYQPIVDATEHTVAGVECLMRWELDGKNVHPDKFIAVAEETRIILELGRWAIIESLRQFKSLHELIPEAYLAVNVSAVQFTEEDFVAFIHEELARHQLPGQALCIEITETSVMSDWEGVNVVLTALKLMGCRIALDDFGTGYSSVSYLQKLPVDCLKIDKSVFEETAGELVNHRLIEGLVALSRKLGLKVVAEGVESAQQFSLCRQVDVDLVQGYFFHRPLRFEQVLALFEAHGQSVHDRLPDPVSS